ncbi:MAG: hypothetical protein ICV51_12780, partial [Flavisolibacter sp.]|nr:hypothetical protein [Flavisolibacter sp.]
MGKPFTKAIEGVNTERYMALEDMDHTRTKATSLQTNGICERLHRTMQAEYYAELLFERKPTLLWRLCKPIW